LKIDELRRPSILLLILGSILAMTGFTMLLNPQDEIQNMIFLSMFGTGLFMSGLGFSLLYQMRKTKEK
jgi:predicted tellurium resistance membrane protein TerC